MLTCMIAAFACFSQGAVADDNLPCGSNVVTVAPVLPPNPLPVKECTNPLRVCVSIAGIQVCVGPDYKWECSAGYSTSDGYAKLGDGPGNSTAGEGTKTVNSTTYPAESCGVPLIDACFGGGPPTPSSQEVPEIVSCKTN